MSVDCSRRQVLRSLVGGSMLLPGILSKLLADDARNDPLAPKAPHFPARAKHVIFLFSTGGVSHLDTFDFKPKLMEMDGKSLVRGGGLSNEKKKLLRPVWPFKPGGRCGTLAEKVDERIRTRAEAIGDKVTERGRRVGTGRRVE